MNIFKKIILIGVMSQLTLILGLVGPWVLFIFSPFLIIIGGISVLLAIIYKSDSLKVNDLEIERPLIVVVDDDAVALHSLKRFFQTMGFRVAAYLNPIAALAEMNNKIFDFAVIDNMMPELNGEEFLLRLDKNYSQISQANRPKVLLFTGSPEVVHFNSKLLQNLNYRGILSKKDAFTNGLLKSFNKNFGIAV